jgi:hypothetical protein
MCHLVHLRNIREELYLLCGLPVDDLQPTCVFSPHPVYNQNTTCGQTLRSYYYI